MEENQIAENQRCAVVSIPYGSRQKHCALSGILECTSLLWLSCPCRQELRSASFHCGLLRTIMYPESLVRDFQVESKCAT
eukprot:1143126-Pelagomonas_calceolata.AAC.1